MKKNYVPIDYENSQPDYLAALESEHFSAIVSSVKEPNRCFHIVSKDTGFDPLVQHLKTQLSVALHGAPACGVK